MSSLGLNIGLKSLLTAQASLESIGHNLANASTPGYSRQRLEVSTSPVLRLNGLLQGTGVSADVVRRTTDVLLHARLVRQMSSVGRLDARLDTLGQAESFMSGVEGLLQNFFDGLSTLSTSPQDVVLRSGAVSSSVELASRLKALSGEAEGLRRETILRLESEVDEVNELARQISELNVQIAGSEAGKLSANDLRDRRDLLLEQLGQRAGVRAIEDQSGAVRVLLEGYLLVSPTTFEQLRLEGVQSGGDVELRLSGSPKPLAVSGGSIGGLMSTLTDFVPDLTSEFDAFAKNLILEANRVHTTGVGAGGPYRLLTGTSPLQDLNQSGTLDDELLSRAGLPFDVTTGELYVNVTNEATGAVEVHRLVIDANRTSVGQFVADLNAIPHLSAGLDARGHLQLSADTGHGFDFSSRLDPDPDAAGTFGGGQASLTTGGAGPFNLSAGDTLDLVGPGGPYTVSFPAGSFAQPGLATAQELAAVIGADPGAQAAGLTATAVGAHLALQTVGSGSSESFTLAGGTALGALGFSAGTVVSGHDATVTVAASGDYTGAQNGKLTFRPSMDGTIGTTPGLELQVFDASGALVAQLDIGPGYVPGEELDVLDGVVLTLGFGEVSATNGDVFMLDVVADADTSDVLPALGLGVLFTGHDAATIGVREDLQRNPELLASSVSGAPGDASNLLQLLELDTRGLQGLGGVALGEAWSNVVGGVALEIGATSSALDSETFLLDSLEQRRTQLSGVNVDEELVFMIEQEQAFQAASQYIRVISDLNNDLMNLL